MKTLRKWGRTDLAKTLWREGPALRIVDLPGIIGLPVLIILQYKPQSLEWLGAVLKTKSARKELLRWYRIVPQESDETYAHAVLVFPIRGWDPYIVLTRQESIDIDFRNYSRAARIFVHLDSDNGPFVLLPLQHFLEQYRDQLPYDG